MELETLDIRSYFAVPRLLKRAAQLPALTLEKGNHRCTPMNSDGKKEIKKERKGDVSVDYSFDLHSRIAKIDQQTDSVSRSPQVIHALGLIHFIEFPHSL